MTATPRLSAYRRSDLQALGDCSQSSQIGPHLVQPLSSRPIAITPNKIATRLNMTAPPKQGGHFKRPSAAFSSHAGRQCALQCPRFMAEGNGVSEQKSAEFDI